MSQPGMRPTVVYRTAPINHTFHLLATVFTCGLWLPVWLAVMVFKKKVPETIWVPIQSPENGQ